MKKLINITVFFLIFLSLISPISSLYAQIGDPPPPPGYHGSSQNLPPGGGAPVGNGLVIFLSLGAAYGGKKMHDFTLKNVKDIEKGKIIR